jgi:mono/diheme cytochrome c family protein
MMTKPLRFTFAALGAVIALTVMASLPFMAAAQTMPAAGAGADVERGRYLARISSCHDCHTPGYPEAAGKVDEKLALVGSPLGYRGPWGTTYATNLRQVAQELTEAQWLVHARAPRRPPMPWFNLRDMSDADVVAIYRYLRHLGPAGLRGQAALPPGQEPAPPYVMWVLPPQK